MNQGLKKKLEKTIEICQSMLDGRVFSVSNSQIDLVPVPVLTEAKAKKAGLVLKRGAKPIGSWSCQVGPALVRIHCDLYKATSFKPRGQK